MPRESGRSCPPGDSSPWLRLRFGRLACPAGCGVRPAVVSCSPGAGARRCRRAGRLSPHAEAALRRLLAPLRPGALWCRPAGPVASRLRQAVVRRPVAGCRASLPLPVLAGVCSLAAGALPSCPRVAVPVGSLRVAAGCGVLPAPGCRAPLPRVALSSPQPAARTVRPRLGAGLPAGPVAADAAAGCGALAPRSVSDGRLPCRPGAVGPRACAQVPAAALRPLSPFTSSGRVCRCVFAAGCGDAVRRGPPRTSAASCARGCLQS